MGVVMQRDDRLDSQTRQVLRSLRLELERGLVELASLWLDAAPFDRIPVGIGPDRRQEGQVGSPPLAMARRQAAADAGLLQPTPGFPIGPVVFCRALDLVGGGGNAPEEVISSQFSVLSYGAQLTTDH
jgi:hypothetical protein